MAKEGRNEKGHFIGGNTIAEKWNDETALELAEKAYGSVSDDTYFISEIAEACETYREVFYYIMDKFNDNEAVFNTLKRMYNKCESIIWRKAANGDIDKTIGIFALKSLHGLFETSKHEIDQTNHEGLKPPSIKFKKHEKSE